MIKRTTVRLPAELLKRAQRKAAAEGRTLTALMEDGLRYVVSDRPAAKAVVRPEIPIGKETGGMMPGIKSIKDIEELQDLEYIDRLNRGFR
jgi:predicted transcriptional regulator